MIKQVMKSPFSGGNAVLRCEPSTLTFRKEEFCYIHQFYECEETHERFTTTELDEANLAQVYNQYRAKYGISFVGQRNDRLVLQSHCAWTRSLALGSRIQLL